MSEFIGGEWKQNMFRLFRPNNAPECVPDFAVRNIHGMRKLCKSLGLGTRS